MVLVGGGVPFGLLVGAIPTASMIIASIILTTFSVDKHTEATFQNFAAGLILAAVASELFPLMMDDVPESDTWIGVTIGFAVGLFLVFGLEPIVDYVTDCFSGESERDADRYQRLASDDSKHATEKLLGGNHHDSSASSGAGKPHPFTPVSPTTVRRKESLEDEEEWEEQHLLTASLAIAQPDHKSHILEHLNEIVALINVMEEKCSYLLRDEPSEVEAEEAAEQIDEATHSLQYKLDHCRRLLQGSESAISGTKTLWVTEERKLAMKRRLELLKMTSDHIVGHVQEEKISVPLLKEIYEHMGDMENIINEFHDTVAIVSNKWIRRNKAMPEPELGSVIPMKLVIPVTMDCFVDGFLIGVSCSLSPAAGIVLGFANCLEMAFLGMAYATRLKKCTGSHVCVRWFALLAPPCLMLAAAGFGAYIANISKDTPFIFVSFVSFGVVALLALVCGELIIEAREAQGEEEQWYIALAIYAGIYLVIMLDRVI